MSNSERIVRLVAVDKRYSSNVYPSVPIKDDSINAYLTGQHIDPKDPSTADNLTMDEMTGRVPVPAEKQKRFPFIIYPELPEGNGRFKTITIPLKHGEGYNLTQEADGTYKFPRDKAMYDYCLYQNTVATAKDRIEPGVTMFYMEDKLAEAAKRVAIEDLIFEAQALVRSSNISKFREIALLLNYSVSNFNINVNVLNELQIKDKLIQACKDHTQEVIDCFAKGVEKDLFVLKLADKRIITKTNGSFYDGKLFLGRTVEEVKSFMLNADNQTYVTKWGRLLETT
jgi:hypothetical protein